jgi:hypothetical protein
MSTIDPNSVHRLVKLALDSGEAATLEEALAIFSRYSLHLHLGAGWNATSAAQAAVATVLACAPRAFLGGVTVFGEVDRLFSLPLFRGLPARVVAAAYGVSVGRGEKAPCLSVGARPVFDRAFSLQLSTNGWQACVSPYASDSLTCAADNPIAGITAAALGVSEAFLYARKEHPMAGHRRVGLSLWNLTAGTCWADVANAGPALELLPSSVWLVGLGHLGQAYAWTLATLPYTDASKVTVFLQDTDSIAPSNVSTSVFASATDIGLKKTRLAARHLEGAGFSTSLVERLLTSEQRVQPGEPRLAFFGVDNPEARRHIDELGFEHVIEAGLGSGYSDFRNIRLHSFPNARPSTEIWKPLDGAQPAVRFNAAYAKLEEETGDSCGVTMLASRAVGTPFVGAFAGALVIAETLRLLHGGPRYSMVDVGMKDLRYVTAAPSRRETCTNPGFTLAAKSDVAPA